MFHTVENVLCLSYKYFAAKSVFWIIVKEHMPVMKGGNLPHEPHAQPVFWQLVRMARKTKRPKLFAADTAAVVRHLQHRLMKQKPVLLCQADFNATALWIVADRIVH